MGCSALLLVTVYTAQLVLIMQNPAAALKIHPSQNETNLDYIFPCFSPKKIVLEKKRDFLY